MLNAAKINKFIIVVEDKVKGQIQDDQLTSHTYQYQVGISVTVDEETFSVSCLHYMCVFT